MGVNAPAERGGVGTGSPMVSNGNQRKPMTLVRIACGKPPASPRQAPRGPPAVCTGPPFIAPASIFRFLEIKGYGKRPDDRILPARLG